MYKVIENNILNIPIGTILHYHSFIQEPRPENNTLWLSNPYYIYKDVEGKLHTLVETQFAKLKVITVIVLCNCKLGYEGEDYYKVFFKGEENETSIKNRTCPFKVYKDRIHSNTNSMFPPDKQRFKTKEEAQEYLIKCNKVKYLYE